MADRRQVLNRIEDTRGVFCFTCEPHDVNEMLELTPEQRTDYGNNHHEVALRNLWQERNRMRRRLREIPDGIRGALLLAVFKKTHMERAIRLAETDGQEPRDAFFVKMMTHEPANAGAALKEAHAIWEYMSDRVHDLMGGPTSLPRDLWIRSHISGEVTTNENMQRKLDAIPSAPPLLPVGKTVGIGPIGRK